MLQIQPITQAEAKAFIRQHHRHHKPPTGWIFGIAVNNGQKVVGVATVGRPVARMLDDGLTAEVNRCCTDGTKNACSILYAACWRAAKALGYRRLITYTLPEEGGASLKGAGWTLLGERGGGSWSCPSRVRVDTHPTQKKLLWEASEQVERKRIAI
jgi:hypothetical protein